MTAGLARFVLGTTALALSACGTVSEPGPLSFADAMARWRATGPANYSYRSAVSCFCLSDFTNPVTITVRAGVVVAVEDRATGAARPTAGRTTIDSLFAVVATEIRDRPQRLQVTYDPVLGYPRSLTYGTPENDGGGFIVADSLVAIP
ncbi:MAG: hypothetical protein HY275_16480 [Gemmatimonadetes bacterium]|nr:hypothetical protein [Gemmatimonadota bacterium]